MPAQKVSDTEIISRLEAGETVEQIWRETHANKDRIRRLRNTRTPLETIPENVVPQIPHRTLVPDHVETPVAPFVRTKESSYLYPEDFPIIQRHCRDIGRSGGKVQKDRIMELVDLIVRMCGYRDI